MAREYVEGREHVQWIDRGRACSVRTEARSAGNNEGEKKGRMFDKVKGYTYARRGRCGRPALHETEDEVETGDASIMREKHVSLDVGEVTPNARKDRLPKFLNVESERQPTRAKEKRAVEHGSILCASQSMNDDATPQRGREKDGMDRFEKERKKSHFHTRTRARATHPH